MGSLVYLVGSQSHRPLTYFFAYDSEKSLLVLYIGDYPSRVVTLRQNAVVSFHVLYPFAGCISYLQFVVGAACSAL